MNQKCPPDIGEQAERYQLGLLSPDEAAALEDHYLGCTSCAAEVERAEAYIAAMRAAAEQLREKEQAPSTATRPA